MADYDPELRARLQELDRELEEGDITEKGYQKRRTLLLSQFAHHPTTPAPAPPQSRSGLSIHSPRNFDTSFKRWPPSLRNDLHDLRQRRRRLWRRLRCWRRLPRP
ncbi:uncharacterized protein TrAtP1_004938 [Trichoderma atroviride]|uniref:uncharacterized protein n=1 Tax=Hypocrea atroviridis TaxID=63577 RepID=UPI003333FEFC|nr:hypothetical protein TrAtP1_004938 [Trichoderma atroviride]